MSVSRPVDGLNISLYDEYIKFEGLKSVFKENEDSVAYELCAKVSTLIADYLNNSFEDKWESGGVFDEIDRVLSIELTDKQKDYLKGKPVVFDRKEGYTTVRIIKQILSGKTITNKSINFEEGSTYFQKRMYLDMFGQIFERFLFRTNLENI